MIITMIVVFIIRWGVGTFEGSFYEKLAPEGSSWVTPTCPDSQVPLGESVLAGV